MREIKKQKDKQDEHEESSVTDDRSQEVFGTPSSIGSTSSQNIYMENPLYDDGPSMMDFHGDPFLDNAEEDC